MLNGLTGPELLVIFAGLVHYFSVLTPDPTENILLIPCIYLLVRGGFETMRQTSGDLRFTGLSAGVCGCAVFLFMPPNIHRYVAPIVVLYCAGALLYPLLPYGQRIKKPFVKLTRRLRKQSL